MDSKPWVDDKQIEATLEKIRASLEAGRVQEAIAALIALHPADRAEAFSDLEDEDQAVILPRLRIRDAADLLEDLENGEAADAAETMAAERLADVLDEMEPDESADVLGDLTPERAAQALSQMEDAEEVIPLLGHPDQSAGRLMTAWFVALRRHTTASQAIDFLRQVGCASRRPTISTLSIARGG